MKIFYPYSEYLPSEKARALQAVNTAYGLAQKGVKVELCAGLKRPGEDILKRYGLGISPELEFVPAAMLREFNFLGIKISWDKIFYDGCIRLLKKRKGDNFFVYTRHIKLASALLKKFPHAPLIYEAHELFSMKRHSFFFLERYVFKNTEGLVFISRSLKEKAEEYFSLKNVPAAVIPDGVNTELIEEAKKNCIPGEVVYVGQLYPWKGVKTLVAGMRHLPQTKLTIVGAGDDKELREIERLAYNLKLRDRINLTGFLPYREALRHMAGAKVLALPLQDAPISRYFTSPLKLFEYMACGIPIVASDLPAIREILHDDSALFVEPGNERELASAIDKLLNDSPLSESLARNSYAASKEYSWDKRAGRIINFLKGLTV